MFQHGFFYSIFADLIAELFKITESFFCWDAVSYTHLDVYKRQTQIILTDIDLISVICRKGKWRIYCDTCLLYTSLAYSIFALEHKPYLPPVYGAQINLYILQKVNHNHSVYCFAQMSPPFFLYYFIREKTCRYITCQKESNRILAKTADQT